MKFLTYFFSIFWLANVLFEVDASKLRRATSYLSFDELKPKEFPEMSPSVPIEKSVFIDEYEQQSFESRANLINLYRKAPENGYKCIFAATEEKRKKIYDNNKEQVESEEFSNLNDKVLGTINKVPMKEFFRVANAISIIAAMVDSGYYTVMARSTPCKEALELVFNMQREERLICKLSDALKNIDIQDNSISIYKFGLFELALGENVSFFSLFFKENLKYVRLKAIYKNEIEALFENWNITDIVKSYKEKYLTDLEAGILFPKSLFISSDNDFEKVQKIPFEERNKIQTIILSNEVTEIPDKTFANGYIYDQTAHITEKADKTASPPSVKGQYYFGTKFPKTGITFKSNGNYFYENYIEKYSTYNIKEILAGEKSALTNIRAMAFIKCDSLKEIVAPNLENVDQTAFYVGNIKLETPLARSEHQTIRIKNYKNELTTRIEGITFGKRLEVSYDYEYFNMESFLVFLFSEMNRLYKPLKLAQIFLEEGGYINLPLVNNYFSQLKNYIEYFITAESERYGGKFTDNINEKTVDDIIRYIESNYVGAPNSKSADDIKMLQDCKNIVDDVSPLTRFLQSEYDFKMPFVKRIPLRKPRIRFNGAQKID